MSAGYDVAVVVPTRDRADRLPALLAALGATADDLSSHEPEVRIRLLVVDDGSTDGTWEVLGACDDVRLAYLRHSGEGPARARNAWRATDADVVAFTDDDCLPDPGWLRALVRAVRTGADVVQGRTDRPTGGLGERSVWREVHGPTPWFEGCNLALTRAALEATGGFDEDRRMDGEDTALGWRAVEAGLVRGYADDARVVHELADRPLRWHLRRCWREHVIVGLAADHPGFRASLWRPWCVRPGDLGDLGLLACLVLLLPAHRGRRRVLAAALLGAPWLVRRKVPPSARAPRQVADRALRDAVGAAGRLYGSAKHRTLVL